MRRETEAAKLMEPSSVPLAIRVWIGLRLHGTQVRARRETLVTFTELCSSERMDRERSISRTQILLTTVARFTNSLLAALRWPVTGPRWDAATVASTSRE